MCRHRRYLPARPVTLLQPVPVNVIRNRSGIDPISLRCTNVENSYQAYMHWFRLLLGFSSRGSASPSTSEAGRTEKRCAGRFRTACKIRISWQDRKGKTKRRQARVMDMSGTGVLIECGIPLDPGSFVYVQTPKLGMMGSAYVRRCEARLFTYQIGLQFAAPLITRF
jgi:hypothetical protein